MGGCISYCFCVCDLYFVLGFGCDGCLVCFCIMIDGMLFGVDYGSDVVVDGIGCVDVYWFY